MATVASGWLLLVFVVGEMTRLALAMHKYPQCVKTPANGARSARNTKREHQLARYDARLRETQRRETDTGSNYRNAAKLNAQAARMKRTETYTLQQRMRNKHNSKRLQRIEPNGDIRCRNIHYKGVHDKRFLIRILVF